MECAIPATQYQNKLQKKKEEQERQSSKEHISEQITSSQVQDNSRRRQHTGCPPKLGGPWASCHHGIGYGGRSPEVGVSSLVFFYALLFRYYQFEFCTDQTKIEIDNICQPIKQPWQL